MTRPVRAAFQRSLRVLVALAVLTNAATYWAARVFCRFETGAEALSLRVPGLARPALRRRPDQLGLAYERHGFPSTDGTFLEGWLLPRPGARGVAVLFHGYGGTKADLLREARVFQELGLSAFLVDFRGCGGSGGDESSIGFHEAKDVAAATAYARTLPGRLPVVVYGISMGAAAVLKAEAEAPLGARALVLECPFDRLSSTIDHRFEVRHVPSFPLSNLLVFWGGWRQGFDGFAHNPVEYARRVRTPVLLLSGANDDLVTPDEAESIARSFPGEARLLLCPGVPHASCLRHRPALAKDALERLLDAALQAPAQASGGGAPPEGGWRSTRAVSQPSPTTATSSAPQSTSVGGASLR
jgi:pimeloyl-ACP methyl ester carboxylesterase